MADLRIVDAPEIPTEDITGEEKLPTGGNGNYSITLDSLADYTKTKKDLADNTSVDGKVNGVRQELDAHIEDLLNPHQVTKGQIGLGNVDNTADADKPVSNSTQSAIISAVAPKADKTYVDSQLTLKANKADVYTKQESSDLVNNGVSTALTPVNSSLELAKRGIANRYDPSLTYNSGERVVLTNGDIVKSTIDGNTNNPNVDMTGWVYEKDILSLVDFMTASEKIAYFNDYTNVDIKDAFDRAVFACNAFNKTLIAFGKFRTSQTLILNCHADISASTLEYSGQAISVDVRANDGGYLSRKNISIGEVVNLNKVDGDNWVDTSATGVRTVNLNRCFFKFNRIQGFAVGLDEYAQGNKGSAYNSYELGQFDNNKIQHMLGGENGATVGTSSWVNQNKHDGGSYSHLSAEGSDIPDCHHLYIRPCLFAVNGNTFNNPSFENNACDFHVVNGGRYNYINQARWEIQGSTPKVKYVCETGSTSVANHGTRNEIIGGYEATAIQFTYDGTGSAFNNVLDTQSRSYFAMDTASGGKRYSNRFSNSEAVFTIFEGTTKRLDAYAPNEWTFAFAANKISGKRTGDEFNRVVLDSQLGYLQLGTGSSSSMATLYGSGTEFYSNRSFMPTNTESQDIGKTSAKWKNLILSGSVGFFGGVPATSKPTITGLANPTTVAEQNAVINSVIAALVSIGIVTDSRT